MTEGLSASDVAVLTGGTGRNNGDGFGGDWGAWIILFLLFGLFGRGGFGGYGGFGGGGGEVQRGFDTSAIVGKLDRLGDGIASLGYDQLAQMNGIQQTLCQGFNGINTTVLQSANGLQAQLADCCCKTQRAIDGVNYNLATQACDTRHAIANSTRDILENNNTNTRAILDFLTQDKIATLQAENQNLKLAASQAAQNSYLLSELKPCPQPAYITCNPFTGQYGGYGYNNGCGCGGNF